MKPLREIVQECGCVLENSGGVETIQIPYWVKHIKIDVGLSYGAPMTQRWLEHENDLMVFGFEPNPSSVARIRDPNNAPDPGHDKVLEHKFLNDKAFILPIALSNKQGETDFYVTSRDQGCSSLYKPREDFVGIVEQIKVPTFKLRDFLQLIPLNHIIEFIKIDAQGHDLAIAQGIEEQIERVVFVTMEPEFRTYYGCEENNITNIANYMQSRNFAMVRHPQTTDPTFLNRKYLHLAEQIYIYQRG